VRSSADLTGLLAARETGRMTTAGTPRSVRLI